jgi:hypothetical protein
MALENVYVISAALLDSDTWLTFKKTRDLARHSILNVNGHSSWEFMDMLMPTYRAASVKLYLRSVILFTTVRSTNPVWRRVRIFPPQPCKS